MKKLVDHIFRFGIAGACIAYALWGVNFSALAQAFHRFDMLRITGLILFSFLGYLLLGCRLRFISSGRVSVYLGTKASIFALGVNNIFPAKLGEVAKALYLGQATSMGPASGLGIVFWERFFDLNMLLALGLLSTISLKLGFIAVPFALAIATGWLYVYSLRRHPHVVHRILAYLPLGRLRLFIDDVNGHVSKDFGPGFALRLLGLTALVWVQYVLQVGAGLNWVGGLPLTPGQVMAVFVISAVGMAVPSSPGAFGMYEASFVFGMGLFGIGKTDALAVALVIHMIQYVPTTVISGIIFCDKRVSVSRLWKRPDHDIAETK